jgi:mRNA interferase HicA
MRFAGQVVKAGKWWAIEVRDLGAFSQGKTKKEAYAMIRDAIEAMIDTPGFTVDVHHGRGSYFEVGSTEDAALVAFFLRQQRGLSGRTLEQVARNLGWVLLREGGHHSVFTDGVRTTSVPRHKEINDNTAKAILKAAKEGGA